MKKYLVVNPWLGVKKGDVIETDSIHPAIAADVKLIEEDRKLEVATPKAKAKK